MPDIVSRIRVEAQGADQAAREIRKLRDAYNEVAQAGRNLSPAGVGADPFAQAISAPGGGVYGGQRAPADIADRQNSARIFRDDVQQRESANATYSQAFRGMPQRIGGGFQVAEAMGRGQPLGAAGGGLGMLGGLLGGPAGIAILAAGAAAFGVQKLSEGSYERLKTIWGSGVAQRMGQDYVPIMEMTRGFRRMGIPPEMTMGFWSAAGQAGMTMDPAMLPATQMAMEAMAMTGVAPGQMAGMLGAMSRAGIGDMGGQYNLYSMMKGTFGQANMGTFVQEITRATETSMQRGIDVNPQEAIRQANLIGAYSQYGGLSPTGAAALSQMTLERGRNAAALSKPEDIIAFQLMRKADPTMSVSETMMAMEEAPTEVNRKVYEYLKGATGGDQELLTFRMKQYLGPGATWGQTQGMIKAFENRSSMTQEERNQLAAGLSTEGWMGRVWDEEKGQWISGSKERQTTAIREYALLEGIQDATLDLTTKIGQLAIGDLKLDARLVGFEGFIPDLAKEISQTQQEVQKLTHQNVEAAFVEIEAQNLTVRQMRRGLSFLEDPRVATAVASGAQMRQDPELMEYFRKQYERAGIGEQFRAIEAPGGTLGRWGYMVSQIAGAMITRAGEEKYAEIREAGGTKLEAREARAALDLGKLYESIMYLGQQDVNLVEALTKLNEIIAELEKRGIVFTDGEAE